MVHRSKEFENLKQISKSTFIKKCLLIRDMAIYLYWEQLMKERFVLQVLNTDTMVQLIYRKRWFIFSIQRL